MDKFDKWLKDFGSAWENLNPDAAMSMFSKDELEYFETVFDKPCTNWDEVYKLWEIIPINQKDVKFWSEILMFDGSRAIVHWKVKRVFIQTNKNQLIDGIFEIKLNPEGLCTYFKQWRSVKES